jgi:hypothetical protein
MMKKVNLFRRYFDAELGEHKTIRKSFEVANRKFEEEKELSGYSCYESFLNAIRAQKKKR